MGLLYVDTTAPDDRTPDAMKDSLRFQRKIANARHNADRFLLDRKGVFSYSRKVPAPIRQHLSDAPETVRLSLGSGPIDL